MAMGRGRRQKEIEEEREVSCLSDRRGLQEKREREREKVQQTLRPMPLRLGADIPARRV